MVVLDASRHGQPVPRLAAWSLGTGIVATVGANLAHGVGHGPVGALVSAWPALALVGSFELSLGVLSAWYDVAPNPWRRASATRLRGCGAPCRCCSDALLSQDRPLRATPVV